MKIDEKYLEVFIRSAINQRQLLIDNKCSRKNIAQARKYIKFLKTHLDLLNHSPKQLAHFFIRNYDMIVFLLPPKRQKIASQLKSDLLTSNF